MAQPTPALARLKSACKVAVQLCGGKEGAGATADRCPSVAGSWGDGNHRAFPPADCALALDEVCVAMGQLPPILRALASELGFTLIALPSGTAAEGELGTLVLGLAEELGQVSARLREALADGVVRPREAAAIDAEVGDLIDRAVQLRHALRALQGHNVIVIKEEGQR